MSLNIYLPPPTAKVERPRIVQRVAAVFGLAGQNVSMDVSHGAFPFEQLEHLHEL